MERTIRQVLESLYDQNVHKIYRFFYFRTLNKEDAEDLTSESFLKFANSAQNTQIDNPKAYLYRIAANTFAQFLREKYAHLEVEFNEEWINQINIDSEAEETDQALSERIQNRLASLIDQLPEKQKQILQLRLIEKKSLQEICAILAKDMNYVKTTQKRGIKKLKELLLCTPSST